MGRFAVIALFVALVGSAPAAAEAKRPGPPPDPFLHVYRETFDGGSVEVVADSYVGHAGVATLQANLRKEAANFARGAYPDPDAKTAAVATLRAGATRMAVRYQSLRRGGRIVLSTKDQRLVAALHDWMAATVRSEQRRHPDGGPGQGSE